MRHGARSLTPLSLATTVSSVLSSYAPLDEEDLKALALGLQETRPHPAGAVFRSVAPDGAAPTAFVVSGWVAWIIQLADGRRQAISLSLPGEPLEGPPASGLEVVGRALTPVRTVNATALVAGFLQPDPPQPRLAAAWGLARKAIMARTVPHALRLGRLSAYERMCSLIDELHERLLRSGMADETRLPIPLTQENLSDVLGLSVVHVNRILQQLRRDELIVYRGSQITVPDRAALRLAAGGRGD